jgi:nicotinate-nucleotide adenylyltransferase
VKIGLFGGTFDPIHVGHLAVAKFALQRFQMDRVFFIPAGCPPHKNRHAPFAERLAMVALACAGNPRFIPSAVEAPAPGKPSYSILTVRKFRKEHGPDAELYFIIGADAFLTIQKWQQWRALLNLAHFVVISRPGFDLARVETVLPKEWKRRGTPRDSHGIEYRLKRSSVFVISGVWNPVSGTDIRAALAPGGRLGRTGRSGADQSLPPPVAEYLRKTQLYAN